MQAINSMNNRSASYLAMGQDMEAIELLRETFALLSDECNSIMEEEEIQQCPKHLVEPPFSVPLVNAVVGNASILVPLFNANSVTVGNTLSESSFVYNNGFILTHKSGTDHHHCHCDHDIAIMSATVIYNTALAYHRMALSAARRMSPCCNSGGWIYKAQTFYQQAIELSLLEIQSTTAGLDHDATVAIAVASYNNLGQINFDLLSDVDTARRCFESVSYLLLQRSAALSYSCESQEENPFSPQDWEGILSNLVFVDISTASVAAAA